MFTQLSIQNFALIEQSEIDWDSDLCILTGETGAGKSILLSALKLILGERADIKSIKNPEKKCVIEATFNISNLNLKSFFDENEIDFEEISILRREILTNGKSRAFINDCPTNLDVLQKLAVKIVNIHSQFETSELLDEKFQMQLLDEFSNSFEILKSFQNTLKIYKQKTKKLVQLQDEYHLFQKESDYNQFLLDELNEWNFEELNFEELENQIKINEHSEQLINEIAFSYQILENEEYGILQFLRQINQRLDKVITYSDELKVINERLNPIYLELEDINSDLVKLNEKFELNPENALKIQTEFNKITQLLLKHQSNTIEELQIIKLELTNKNSNFVEIEQKIADFKIELTDLEVQLNEYSEKLHLNRSEFIPLLQSKILELISRLGMEKASIEIELIPSEKFTDFGKENIQIYFSANVGMNPKALDKAISGGERSRVMLALKYILAANSSLPTLIFDEIDTGVSGKIADEMGKMILEMAQKMQVIVITHLPQMASKGKNHFKVFKYEEDNQTKSSIKKLNTEERIHEIANLLSGSKVTESAINQAKELILS